MNSQHGLEGMVKYAVIWRDGVTSRGNLADIKYDSSFRSWLKANKILHQEVPISSRRATLYVPQDKIDLLNRISQQIKDQYYTQLVVDYINCGR